LFELEHLTKPVDLVEVDEGAAEDHEGFVDVGAPLVADGEALEAVEPGERSLHDPSVSAKPLAGFHAAPGDARFDGAGAEARRSGCEGRDILDESDAPVSDYWECIARTKV
jgi:hypothetical protein